MALRQRPDLWLGPALNALEATEAGAELAQRMAAVGNWSQMQRGNRLWVPVNDWYACSACGA